MSNEVGTCLLNNNKFYRFCPCYGIRHISALTLNTDPTIHSIHSKAKYIINAGKENSIFKMFMCPKINKENVERIKVL